MKTLDFWARGSLKRLSNRPRVLFASVHEDAEVELCALRAWQKKHPGQTARVFCVASGGDTVFALLLARDAEVEAVDVNFAQIALCELKIAAISILNERDLTRALSRDARFCLPILRPHLSPAAGEFWDKNAPTLRFGLQNCGVLEAVLRLGARVLGAAIGRPALRALFAARDLETAQKVFFARWNSPRWRGLLAATLNPLVLQIFYARGFLSAIPPDFAGQLRRQIETTILNFLPRENPFLWQDLRAQMPPDPQFWPPAFQPQNRTLLRANLAQIQLHHADAAQFLETAPPASFDFFAFSNILDAVPPAQIARLMQAAAQAASPDALLCQRAIWAPTGDLNKTSWEEETTLTRFLQAQDRAPVCRLWRVWRREKMGDEMPPFR